MRINPAVVQLIYRTELHMLLRDYRALLMAIVLPMLIFPIMLLLTNSTREAEIRRQETRISTYALTGALTPETRTLLDLAFAAEATHFTRLTPADPVTALQRGEVDLLIECHPPSATENGQTPRAGLIVHYRSDRMASFSAMDRWFAAYDSAMERYHELLLYQQQVPLKLAHAGEVTTHDIADKQVMARRTLGQFITPVLLLLIFMAGALVAVDSLAGEKERGTLETLLTTAAFRADIVAAKLLLILSVTLLVTVIQLGNYLLYVRLHLLALPAGLFDGISLGTILLLLLLFLPVILLVSAVLLLVSGYAKTYKEAQLFFTPVLLVGMLPSLAPLLPDASLRSLFLLVPIANIGLAVRDVLTGAADWPLIAVAWLLTTGVALWVGVATTRLLVTEHFITATDHDDDLPAYGPLRFSRQVLRWFAVLWALMVIAGLYLATPAQLPWQLVVNLGLLFVGGPVVMIRRFRLNWREALSIRPVRPIVWPAILLAAPAGIIVGVGLSQLSNMVLPVPQEWLQQFNDILALDRYPLWQQLLGLAVLPGICEEIAFRGMLLYGLRGRLRPLPLVIIIGLIFGFFHFALFRFATTALLGALLATVTLLTGSIFPAMLWHMLNNGLALVAGPLLEQLPPISYPIAAVVLTACLLVIYRYGRRKAG